MTPVEYRDEPGLFLQVEIGPEAVRVVSASRIPRVGRGGLRAPLLTAQAPPSWRGSSEIVAALLDGRGAREQFAWSTRSIAFMDREDDDRTGAIVGRPRESQLATRLLRIPAAADTPFLAFYRAEYPRGADGRPAEARIDYRLLGLYYLGPPGEPFPPPPPLPFPWGPPPLPLPLPYRPARSWIPERPRMRNYLAGSNTLVDSGPPADRFDIVILGDGFNFAELAEFDYRAQVLADGLMAMAPFSTLAGKINIHTVRAVSLESGITDCPAVGTGRSTYFDVRGNFNGLYPGFVGTTTPDRIYQAAELIAPRAEIEVFFVIANCAIEGGSAFPDQRLGFITMYADMTRFVNFAAHELGHVIAKSAEEYIGCAEWDPANIYPNQVTDADRTADNISWKSLALANELDRQGRFRAQHVFGDPFDANNQPVVAPELTGMLGAYWGCQDIAPGSSSPACDPYQDSRGQGFFRPMAACRMRKSFFNFCRVCSAKISDAITAAAP